MKVIILAAGYAKRMRTVTNNGEIAKTLLPIKIGEEEKPILYFLLDKVAELPQVDEIMFLTNDKYYTQISGAVEAYQQQTGMSVPTNFYSDGSTEENPAGANMALLIANENISPEYEDDILVLACDNYFEFGLNKFVEGFENLKQQHGSNINLVAIKHYPESKKELIASKFGIVETNSEGRIVDIAEKPGIANLKSTDVSLALYLFNRDDFNLIESYMCLATGKERDSLGFFIKHIITYCESYAQPVKGKFLDIGTPEEYEEIAASCNCSLNEDGTVIYN